MPRVKFNCVVSFSSEDKDHPASNLLAEAVSKKKWLCCKGEPSCSVVLQLSHSVEISTITVGTHDTALVEVLVGRSENLNEFEVIVPSCIFLSPSESRRGEGLDRVRTFTGDQLTAAARGKKWDRVRVVCTQPYNRHVSYGLTFIHVTSAEEVQAPPPAPLPSWLTLEDKSSDEDSYKPGQLFATYMQKKKEESAGPSSTDAQIRRASSQALKNIPETTTHLVKTPITKEKTNSNKHNTKTTNYESNSSRDRDKLIYEADDEKPNAKIDLIVNRHKEENRKDSETDRKDHRKSKDNEKERRRSDAKKDDLIVHNHKEENRKGSEKDGREHRKSKDNEKERRRSDVKKDDLIVHNHKEENRKGSETDRQDHRKSKDNEKDKRRSEVKNDDKKNDDEKMYDKKFDDKNRSKNESRKHDRSRSKDKLNTSQSKDQGGSNSGLGSKESSNIDRKRNVDQNKTVNEAAILKAGPVSQFPHKLLSHVVFTMSGYENPRRGNVRSQALAMGARYERDWTTACTHLICAFPKTPKLQTVRSLPKGDTYAVTTASWIEECCEHRRLLPWQWYATEPARKVNRPSNWIEQAEKGDEMDDYEAQETNDGRARPVNPDSDMDTDDEIEQVIKKRKLDSERASKNDDRTAQSSKTLQNGTKKRVQINSDSDLTDTDDQSIKYVGPVDLNPNATLPDFFDGYVFIVDSSVAKSGCDLKTLHRYIRAYGGEILKRREEDNIESLEGVNFVVCSKGGDVGKVDGPAYVAADWVWRCHEKRRCCSYDRFLIK